MDRLVPYCDSAPSWSYCANLAVAACLTGHTWPCTGSAGTLPLRVSPSKTPVRFDARRSSDVRIQSAGVPLAVPGVRAGMPLLPAHMGVRLQGAPLPQQAMSAGTPQQFPPALLMAAAGQMYAGARFW